MKEIAPRIFKIFALSLPKGLDFGDHIPVSSWMSDNQIACGLIQYDECTSTYSFFAMRRREDDIWVIVETQDGIDNHSDAKRLLDISFRASDPKEIVPSGSKKRKALYDLENREACSLFKYLATPFHLAAAWVLNQVYLALPTPDPNFVSDFQTGNFHTRLWELYLLACFREQGLEVLQDHVSPDFMIRRHQICAWIEAVTANAETPYDHVHEGAPAFAPEDKMERQLGRAAFRYAKTLRSKLERDYQNMEHVTGNPFAIAIADFHAPSSMVWSREALPCYLYGTAGKVIERAGKKVPIEVAVDTLMVDGDVPAGIFRDPAFAHLSAIIHSNAGTIAKFNRMGFLAGYQKPGLKLIRKGVFFDRVPGAVEPIDFEFDISGEEYSSLWPDGENWSLELEVYHNPNAEFPLPFELLPLATHWFEKDKEIICQSPYEFSILASTTLLLEEDEKS
ncbi:MAG: hypothetical protein AB2799_13110 [Candidatus Thiodiazotropha sp.]